MCEAGTSAAPLAELNAARVLNGWDKRPQPDETAVQLVALLSTNQTMPLTLIRMREPYVDTESVSADPIKPGDQRDFRLVLDHIAQDWNSQYPEVRVIQVVGK